MVVILSTSIVTEMDGGKASGVDCGADSVAGDSDLELVLVGLKIIRSLEGSGFSGPSPNISMLSSMVTSVASVSTSETSHSKSPTKVAIAKSGVNKKHIFDNMVVA